MFLRNISWLILLWQECISHSAVLTKFAQHTDNGKAITKDLASKLEKVCDKALGMK